MPDATPPPPSLRHGVHDLRNVLNAVQINAFAARQLVDDATRTLACIDRIEQACKRGTGVLQELPAEETLATAAAILRERLADAGRHADVLVGGDLDADVPGLLRQALCLAAVESQALGAHAFRISGDMGSYLVLRCEALGLAAPGPVVRAMAEAGVGEMRLDLAPMDDGWALRWTLPAQGFAP